MIVSNKLLLKEYPLQVLPTLATIFGLLDALVLQQVHYWLRKSKHTFDGRQWVYNSYPGWKLQFPFVSAGALKRTFLELEARGIIISGMYAKDRRNRSKWYTIDYDKMIAIVEDFEKCTGSKDSDLTGTKEDGQIGIEHDHPLSETTTETNTDIKDIGSFATSVISSNSLVEKPKAFKVPPDKCPSDAELAENYRVRWNNFIDYANTKYGSVLGPVDVLSPKAIVSVCARHRTKGFDFTRICNIIVRSQFLLGLVENPTEGRGKHWKGASFDFIFLHPHAWAKILNGDYDDTKVYRRTYVPISRQGDAAPEISKERADRIAEALRRVEQGSEVIAAGA